MMALHSTKDVMKSGVIADSLGNGRELMIPLPERPRCPPLQTTIVDLPVACLNICAITNGNVWPLSNLCV